MCLKRLNEKINITGWSHTLTLSITYFGMRPQKMMIMIFSWMAFPRTSTLWIFYSQLCFHVSPSYFRRSPIKIQDSTQTAHILKSSKNFKKIPLIPALFWNVSPLIKSRIFQILFKIFSRKKKKIRKKNRFVPIFDRFDHFVCKGFNQKKRATTTWKLTFC